MFVYVFTRRVVPHSTVPPSTVRLVDASRRFRSPSLSLSRFPVDPPLDRRSRARDRRHGRLCVRSSSWSAPVADVGHGAVLPPRATSSVAAPGRASMPVPQAGEGGGGEEPVRVAPSRTSPHHAVIRSPRTAAIRLTPSTTAIIARCSRGARSSREHPARSVDGAPWHFFFFFFLSYPHAFLPDSVLRSANAILTAPPSLHIRHE